MHLADAFIQSDLQCIQAIHFFVSTCVPWESNPTTFALLTQCSNHWATGTHIYDYFCLFFLYKFTINPKHLNKVVVQKGPLLSQQQVNISSWFPVLLVPVNVCLNTLILPQVLVSPDLLLCRECVCISVDFGVGNPPYEQPSCMHVLCVHAGSMQCIEQHYSFCISIDWGTMWEFSSHHNCVYWRSWPCHPLIGFHAADHLLYYHPNVK